MSQLAPGVHPIAMVRAPGDPLAGQWRAPCGVAIGAAHVRDWRAGATLPAAVDKQRRY